MSEKEQLIQAILDQNKATFEATQGNILPDWLNMDLTMPQLKIIFLLYWHKRIRMSELAHLLTKNISTATGVVDRLVEHKLVKREEDPEDRRVVIVTITSEGNRLCESLYQMNRRQNYDVLNQMDEDELKIVAQATQLFCKAMQTSVKEQRAKTAEGNHQ